MIYIIESRYRVINSSIKIRTNRIQVCYLFVRFIMKILINIAPQKMHSFMKLNYVFIEAKHWRKQGDWTTAKTNYGNCGKLAREYFQSRTTFYSLVIIMAALH